jgi:hypothetical protein
MHKADLIFHFFVFCDYAGFFVFNIRATGENRFSIICFLLFDSTGIYEYVVPAMKLVHCDRLIAFASSVYGRVKNME